MGKIPDQDKQKTEIQKEKPLISFSLKALDGVERKEIIKIIEDLKKENIQFELE